MSRDIVDLTMNEIEAKPSPSLAKTTAKKRGAVETQTKPKPKKLKTEEEPVLIVVDEDEDGDKGKANAEVSKRKQTRNAAIEQGKPSVQALHMFGASVEKIKSLLAPSVAIDMAAVAMLVVGALWCQPLHAFRAGAPNSKAGKQGGEYSYFSGTKLYYKQAARNSIDYYAVALATYIKEVASTSRFNAFNQYITRSSRFYLIALISKVRSILVEFHSSFDFDQAAPVVVDDISASFTSFFNHYKKHAGEKDLWARMLYDAIGGFALEHEVELGQDKDTTNLTKYFKSFYARDGAPLTMENFLEFLLAFDGKLTGHQPYKAAQDVIDSFLNL